MEEKIIEMLAGETCEEKNIDNNILKNKIREILNALNDARDKQKEYDEEK